MKTYKMVYLNKGFSITRERDLAKSEEVINKYAAEGWTLQQVVSPADLVGALVGIFYKEE